MTHFLLGSLTMFYAMNANAYLDPGTGSLILQGIIAAVAAAGMTIRHYWHQIQAFFGKKGNKSLLEDDEADESGSDQA